MQKNTSVTLGAHYEKFIAQQVSQGYFSTASEAIRAGLRTLRTGILRVAKHRARCIASYIHKLFLKFRNGMSDFSTERIDQLVREYIRQTLEDDEKCRSASRICPVNDWCQCIQSCLIDHAGILKGKGETRLFPELRQSRDGYGQTVSKWFGRYKKRLGFGEGQNFHSFRHTFITNLKHKQVDPNIIHELDGHTIENETMGR